MLALAERSQHRGLHPGMAEEIKEDFDMKYIAYGSNMVQEQMAFRCSGAKLIGTGWLLNVLFPSNSQHGGGGTAAGRHPGDYFACP